MGRGIFTSFIEAAMREAVVERLEEGTFFARIPSCAGVWAEGANEEECLAILQEVLEEWLLFKLRDGDKDIPLLGGVDLNHEWVMEHYEAGQQAGINQAP